MLLLLLAVPAVSDDDSNSSEKQKSAKWSIEVTINGLSDDLTDTIRSHLPIVQYQDYASESRSNLYLMYNQSKKAIGDLLEPYGYFNASVKSRIQQQGDHWIISYQIDPGDKMMIKQVNVVVKGPGKQDQAFKQLLKSLPLKQAVPLKQADYNEAKNQLLSTANKNGYLDAQLTKHQIDVNRQSNQAEVYLTLETGEQYHIGAVHLNQKNYQFYSQFLRKYIQVQSNQVYNQKNIQKTIKNLQSTNYFSDVRVIPQLNKRNAKDNTVDVDVDTTSAKTATYGLGAGFGTYTGFRALAQTEFHHLTPSGHYATMTAEVSEINVSFLGQYIIPGDDPLNEYWSINAQQSLLNLVPYESLQTNGGVNRIDQGDWYSSNLGIQQYYISYRTPASDGTRYGTYLVPNWFLDLDLSYQDGFWYNGAHISNLTQGSAEYILSDHSFIRNLTKIEYSFPLMKQWNRFIVATNLGFLALADATDVPPQFRFYAGGIGNLLGYDYLSQGPTNAKGQLTGGRYLGTISAALEQRVYGNFSVLGYYNMGNATNSLTFNDVPILHGVGGGIAYQTPIGSIQAYLTRTLNPGMEQWKFDFSLGVML